MISWAVLFAVVNVNFRLRASAIVIVVPGACLITNSRLFLADKNQNARHTAKIFISRALPEDNDMIAELLSQVTLLWVVSKNTLAANKQLYVSNSDMLQCSMSVGEY